MKRIEPLSLKKLMSATSDWGPPLVDTINALIEEHNDRVDKYLNFRDARIEALETRIAELLVWKSEQSQVDAEVMLLRGVVMGLEQRIREVESRAIFNGQRVRANASPNFTWETSNDRTEYIWKT